MRTQTLNPAAAAERMVADMAARAAASVDGPKMLSQGAENAVHLDIMKGSAGRSAGGAGNNMAERPSSAPAGAAAGATSSGAEAGGSGAAAAGGKGPDAAGRGGADEDSKHAAVDWDDTPIPAAMPWDDVGDGVGPLGPEQPEAPEAADAAQEQEGGGGGGRGTTIVMRFDEAELLQKIKAKAVAEAAAAEAAAAGAAAGGKAAASDEESAAAQLAAVTLEVRTTSHCPLNRRQESRSMRRSRNMFDCTVCSGTGSTDGAGRRQGYYPIRKQGRLTAQPLCVNCVDIYGDVSPACAGGHGQQGHVAGAGRGAGGGGAGARIRQSRLQAHGGAG